MEDILITACFRPVLSLHLITATRKVRNCEGRAIVKQ